MLFLKKNALREQCFPIVKALIPRVPQEGPGFCVLNEKTVSTHKTRVLEKLGVVNVVALANLLAHHNMLTPGRAVTA